MSELRLKHANKLRGAQCLILGGSSGIGFGVAEALLEFGARVTISGSSQSKIDNALTRLQTAFPESKGMVSGFACDLSKRAHTEANLTRLLDHAVAAAQQDGKTKLDHIVFTAGDGLTVRPIADMSVQEMDAVGDVRFFGPLVLGKLAPRYMATGPGTDASITLTSGVMSKRPHKNWAVQTAWLNGTEGIMRGLAVDLAPIRVNLVSSGPVQTELFGNFPPEQLDGIIASFKAMGVLGKIGTPEEAAEPYLYCIRSAFTTGSIVVVDGGFGVK